MEDSKGWSRHVPYPVTLHGAFLDMYPGSTDPRVVALAHDRFVRGLEAAEALGAGLIVFHTGYNPMVRGPGRLEKWVERSAAVWRAVLRSGAYMGTVVVENMWEPSPEPVRLLCEAVDLPNFAACIDTGHINVFSRVPLAEWAEQLAPWVKHLHIADNRGEWDEHLAAGQGTFDFDQFFSLLRSYGAAQLGAALETTDPAGQVVSFEWLKSRGFLVGTVV